MAEFQNCIGPLIKKEGGYVFTKYGQDRGGETFAGISRQYNHDWKGWQYLNGCAHGTVVERDDLKELVHELYRVRYWNPIQGQWMPEDLATMMLSSAVLDGAVNAIIMFQQCVDAYPDGILGEKTKEAFVKYNRVLKDRGSELIVLRLALRRIQRYHSIVRGDSSQRVFLEGWIARVLGDCK